MTKEQRNLEQLEETKIMNDYEIVEHLVCKSTCRRNSAKEGRTYE